MLFLKDVETPRNTSGTFSDDDDTDNEGSELGQSDIGKSDSYEDNENDEDLIEKETTHSFDGINTQPIQNNAQEFPQTSTFNVYSSETTQTKFSGQKKKK